jgi:hypothetical protein
MDLDSSRGRLGREPAPERVDAFAALEGPIGPAAAMHQATGLTKQLGLAEQRLFKVGNVGKSEMPSQCIDVVSAAQPNDVRTKINALVGTAPRQ